MTLETLIVESTISSWLDRIGSEQGERKALVTASGNGLGKQISFGELCHRAQRISAGFAKLGLRAGDALAIWLPNNIDWMLTHFAAARLGLRTIPINTWNKEAELTHLLSISSAKALVLDSSFAFADVAVTLAAVRNVLGDSFTVQWVIDVADNSEPSNDVIDLASIEASPGEAPEATDVNDAVIAYSTSGTTSLPKLAQHSEKNILDHARAVVRRAGLGRNDVVLCALPPCGAYGYGLIMAALECGARAIQCPVFSVDLAVRLIAEEGVTVMALTEPLMRDLLDHSKASEHNYRNLRIVFSAGATLEPVVRRAQRDFGFSLTNVYGSSEVLALAAFWDCGMDIAERSAAGGRLVNESMRVRAVGQTGKVLPPGEQGELQFKGPCITSGYLGNSDATDAAFTSDGWFHSQDLGQIEDETGSSFRYVARMNDALRVKGFLVNPGEIEMMLQTHPAVSAAQVVGVSDGKGEESAVGFVTLADQASATGEELRAFCKANMAAFKTPALIAVMKEFPVTRSANGDKVKKNQLRELAKGMMHNE